MSIAALDSEEHDVAIKVLKPELCDPRNRARFLRGARCQKSLESPHVVRVFSVEEAPGESPFVVTEYVDGETLQERANRLGRLRAQEAAEIVRQVALGLGAAHDRGVVHRDVKPANILLERFGLLAKITDFGLARDVELPPEITSQGEVAGTPQFMSPEQILTPARVDSRADVYGLGVVLYHALTAELPFRGGLLDVLKQVLEDEPKPPRRLNHTVPRDLETICLKCMENSRHRYASAAALEADLQRYLDGQPIQARRPGIARRALRWVRRHPGFAAALLVIVTITTSLGIVGSINAIHLGREAESAREVASALAQRDRQSRRELLKQKVQHILLTPHTHEWSSRIGDLTRQLVDAPLPDAVEKTIEDQDVKSLATSAFEGYDAQTSQRFEAFGAVSLAYDPTGTRLLMGLCLEHKDRTDRTSLGTKIWNSATRELEDLGTLAGEGPVAFRHDGTPVQLVLPTKDDEKAVSLWDWSRRTTLRRFEVPGTIHAQFFGQFGLARDGSLVAIPIKRPSGEVALIVGDLDSGKILHEFPVNNRYAAFSPDRSLIAAGDESGRIAVWSLATGSRIAALNNGRSAVLGLAFHQDPGRPSGTQRRGIGEGWLLATGDSGSAVKIWDLETQSVRAICRGSSNEVTALAFSPDGTILASTGRVRVKLWDAQTGQNLLDFDYSNQIYGLAFSPDGHHLAVGCTGGFGYDKHTRVWNLSNGRGLKTLRGLQAPVKVVAVSADGRNVAGLAQDYQIGVWDRATGQLRFVFDAPVGLFADTGGMAFRDDGRRLAVCTDTGARLWDLEAGRQIGDWNFHDAEGNKHEALLSRVGFPEPNRLLAFRVETKDGKNRPFNTSNALKEPRVCRIRDLLSEDPLRPVALIEDFNLDVRHMTVGPGGRYLIMHGVGGDQRSEKREIAVFNGISGLRLWDFPLVGKNARGAEVEGSSFIDPSGRFAALLSPTLSGDKLLYELATGRQVAAIDPKFPGNYPSSEAKLWLGQATVPTTGASVKALYRQGRDEPVALFGIQDNESTPSPAISADGRRMIWGNFDGTVRVAELDELQDRLAPLGLGW